MTDENKNICGEITDAGEICTLVAGWGRDSSDGPCKWHCDNPKMPHRWSHDRIETIISETSRTGSFKYACGIASVGYSTARRWFKEGREIAESGDEPTSERDEEMLAFWARVTHARDEARGEIAADVVEMSRDPENPRPEVLLRYLKELEGGFGSDDSDDDETDWFAELEDAEERALEQYAEEGAGQ